MGLVGLFAVALGGVLIVGTVGLVRAIAWPPRKTLAVALARGEPGDPADLNLEAEAVTFALTRGVTSPGWVIRGACPTGPAVIIAHGHRNSRYGSLRRAARFVPFASRVVVYDQPGHGDASGGRCTLGAREPADLLRVVEQLDAPRVVLFGSSMGAGIAIAAAGRCERVVGVIAEAPFRTWRQATVNTLRIRRLPTVFVWLAAAALRVMGIDLRYDRVADAALLRCPLLLLHARHDPIAPFSATRAIAAAAPHSTIVAFEDDRHGDLALIDEGLYHDALAAFFNSLR